MHKERSRLIVQHVIVQRGHLDARIAQRGQHRFHLLRFQHEIAGDRGLAATCRLEIDSRGGAHGGRHRHAIVDDRVATRDAELQHAADGIALAADHLLDLLGVEIRFRRRRCARCRKRRVADRERIVQCRGQARRVAVSIDMHVERGRLRTEQVIVHGRHRHSAGQQLRHHRIDLVLGQDKIAHHHRTVAFGLEREPAAEGQSRQQRHAVDRHVQIGARESVAMHIAGHRRTGSTQRLIDLAPVGGCGKHR